MPSPVSQKALEQKEATTNTKLVSEDTLTYLAVYMECTLVCLSSFVTDITERPLGPPPDTGWQPRPRIPPSNEMDITELRKLKELLDGGLVAQAAGRVLRFERPPFGSQVKARQQTAPRTLH